MALNPPITQDGIPMAVPGERYLCYRTNIKASISMSNPRGKVSGTGQLFLTTKRLCFVVQSGNPKIPGSGSALHAVDMPISHVTHQEFKQPIFGANYLECHLNPVPSMGTQGTVEVKLEFRNGGCGLFLKLWFPLMQAIEPATPGFAWEGFVERVDDYIRYASGSDPSDPTHLYSSQPDVPTAPAIGPSGAGYAYYDASTEGQPQSTGGQPASTMAETSTAYGSSTTNRDDGGNNEAPPPYDASTENSGNSQPRNAYRAAM